MPRLVQLEAACLAVAVCAASVNALCTVANEKCYVDADLKNRVLRGSNPSGQEAQWTPRYCAQKCSDDKFALAGIEYGGECYCGNVLAPGTKEGTGCTMPCKSQKNISCGGDFRISVYKVQCSGPPEPAPPGPPPSVKGNPCVGTPTSNAPWCDHTKPIADRVAALVANLTLEEKATLFTNGAKSVPRVSWPGFGWWSEAGLTFKSQKSQRHFKNAFIKVEGGLVGILDFRA